MELLAAAPVEPREVMRYAGKVLQELQAARHSNETVKEIIYLNRRRS